MPRIDQYDAGVRAFQPSEAGAETLARTARYKGFMGSELGSTFRNSVVLAGRTADDIQQQIDEHQTNQDILDGALAHTQLDAKAATDLPQVLAKADDPVKAVQDYFEQSYMPAAEKITDGMQTKRSRLWAAEHAASASQSFFQHGMAEALNIQGARAVSKFDGAVNNLTTAVHANPDGLAGYVDQADNILDSIKDQFSPQQQAQLEEHKARVHSQLALAAGHSLADQNPAQFKSDLDKGWGSDFLDAEQRQQLDQYTQYATRQQIQQKRQGSADAINDMIGSLYDDNGRVKQITPAFIGSINSNPDILPQDRHRAVSLAVSAFKQQQAEDDGLLLGRAARNDPVTAADIIGRIGDPDNPATIDDVTKAMKDGKLTVGTGLELANKVHPKAVDLLAKINANPLVKAELDRADTMIRGNIDTSMPGAYDAVKGKAAQFKLDALRTLQGVAMNGGDIQPYLDPKSPQYMFTPDRILQYAPNQEELANGIIKPQTPGGAQAPAQPPLSDREKEILKYIMPNMGALPPPKGQQ